MIAVWPRARRTVDHPEPAERSKDRHYHVQVRYRVIQAKFRLHLRIYPGSFLTRQRQQLGALILTSEMTKE